jgi:para-nitrobenzyl esterase
MEGFTLDIVVNTRQGAVRGSSIDGIATFKGIPYAANPFGQDRFRPPQRVQAWDGVRDALGYGPTAPKPGYAVPFDKLLSEPFIAGLDCLNLNVWLPDTGQAGLPVMVWIHGGSFVNGSGAVPTYNGRRFARDGVVCVTINYRLGSHGFLYLGEGTANLGMLDQVAALEWVQENIAAFGGDPANVTIFGESAGAFSVCTLLAMPRPAGLFRRAILQSGAGHHALPPETSRLVGQYLAEKLDVEPTVDGLASVPLERMIAAQAELSNEVNTRPDPARWREILFNYSRESAIYNKGASKVRKGKLLVKCCQISSLYHHAFSSYSYYRESMAGSRVALRSYASKTGRLTTVKNGKRELDAHASDWRETLHGRQEKERRRS